jgi:hypothetical protein
MSAAVRGAVVVALLCIAAALIWWFGLREHPAPPPAPATTPVPVAEAPKASPSAVAAPSLPALAESDDEMLQLASRLLGNGIEKYLLRPRIVHRIVATVDSLPRSRVPLQVMPVRPVGGTFLTTGSGPALAISPDNADRYARYMEWVARMDTAQVVAAYRRDYPLFQQAYRELGYPNGEFNDRLIEAIDDLLEAPQPSPPVLLVVPRAMFEYADASLQDASAGQKILIRLGADNEARVKTKLRELRRALDGVELPR